MIEDVGGDMTNNATGRAASNIMELRTMYNDDDILYTFMILNSLHDKQDHMLVDHMVDVEDSRLSIIQREIQAFNEYAARLGYEEDYYSKDIASGMQSMTGLSDVKRGSIVLELGDVSEEESDAATKGMRDRRGLPSHSANSKAQAYDQLQQDVETAYDLKNKNRYNLYFGGKNTLGRRALKNTPFPNLVFDRTMGRNIAHYIVRKNELDGWEYGLLGMLPGTETREEKLHAAQVQYIDKPLAEMQGQIAAHKAVIDGCMNTDYFKAMQQYYFRKEVVAEEFKGNLERNVCEYATTVKPKWTQGEAEEHMRLQISKIKKDAEKAKEINDMRIYDLSMRMIRWYEERLDSLKQPAELFPQNRLAIMEYEYKDVLKEWYLEQNTWYLDDLIRHHTMEHPEFYSKITAFGHVEEQIYAGLRLEKQLETKFPTVQALTAYLKDQKNIADKNMQYAQGKNMPAHDVAERMSGWYADRIAQLEKFPANTEFNYDDFIKDYDKELKAWLPDIGARDLNGKDRYNLTAFYAYGLSSDEFFKLEPHVQSLLMLRQKYREMNPNDSLSDAAEAVKKLMHGDGMVFRVKGRIKKIKPLSETLGIAFREEERVAFEKKNEEAVIRAAEEAKKNGKDKTEIVHYNKINGEDLSGGRFDKITGFGGVKFEDMIFDVPKLGSGCWTLTEPFSVNGFVGAVARAGLIPKMPSNDDYAQEQGTGVAHLDTQIIKTLKERRDIKIAYECLRMFNNDFMQVMQDPILRQKLSVEIDNGRAKPEKELVQSLDFNSLSQKMHRDAEHMLIGVSDRLLQPGAAAEKTFTMFKDATGMFVGFTAGIATLPAGGVTSFAAGVAADILTTQLIEATEELIKLTPPYQLLNYCTSSDDVLEVANNGIWDKEMPLYRKQLEKLTDEYEQRVDSLSNLYTDEDMDKAIHFALYTSTNSTQIEFLKTVKLGRKLQKDLEKELNSNSEAVQKCGAILQKLKSDPENIELKKQLETYQTNINSPTLELIIERAKLHEEVNAITQNQVRLVSALSDLSAIEKKVNSDVELTDAERKTIHQYIKQQLDYRKKCQECGKEQDGIFFEDVSAYTNALRRINSNRATKADEYIIQLFNKYQEIQKIENEKLPAPFSEYMAKKYPQKWEEMKEEYIANPKVMKQLNTGRLPKDYLLNYQKQTMNVDNAINGALSGNVFYWASSKEILSDNEKNQANIESTEAFWRRNYRQKDIDNLKDLSKAQTECISAMTDYSLRMQLLNVWERSGKALGDFEDFHSRNFAGDTIDLEETLSHSVENNDTDDINKTFEYCGEGDCDEYEMMSIRSYDDTDGEPTIDIEDDNTGNDKENDNHQTSSNDTTQACSSAISGTQQIASLQRTLSDNADIVETAETKFSRQGRNTGRA